MIDLMTGVACAAMLGAGFIGWQFVTKRREAAVQHQVALVTVRAVTLGGVSELGLTPEQAEEADLEKAYAHMPLRWALTGSRYSILTAPVVMAGITVLFWIPLVLLFPAYFEGYVPGTSMELVGYWAWLLGMIVPPGLTLFVTLSAVIDWLEIRRKWGVES